MKSKQKTVVVGLSGGVDSAVAALLLKKKGYKVIGAFMKNYSDTKNPFTGECSYVEDKKMSQKVAIHLGIEWKMFDFEKEYKKDVIEPMFRGYSRGLTPNPDITCNTLIKFPLFWKEAKKLGADYIAMGHYARIMNRKGKYELLAGKDKQKDQSYFLSELNQEDLSHTLFPIGEMTKEEVREIARNNKLPNWERKGTSGVCFVGNINFGKFLASRIKKKEGKVLTPWGLEIGGHEGAGFYTLGQKAGDLNGIRINKPKGFEQKRFYVCYKDVKKNIVIVAPEGHEDLKKNKVYMKEFHFISGVEEKGERQYKARIRHLGKLYTGRLIKEKGKWVFNFKKGIEGIAPGQFLVVYLGERVLGCGEIK